MKITNSSPSFGIKFNTTEVLEVTSSKMIHSETVTDQKKFIDLLWDKPFKAAGNRGYRYYLQIIGQRILDKYPDIAQATKEIKNYISAYPKASKDDLKKFVKPISERIGQEIDITL